MPLLEKPDPSSSGSSSLHDKIIDAVEREVRELADIGIGMLSDALKKRLGRQRLEPRVQPGTDPQAASSSPYETLRVSPEASDEEVEKAFRKRVKACHPDLKKGGSEEEMRQVLIAIRQIREERKT